MKLLRARPAKPAPLDMPPETPAAPPRVDDVAGGSSIFPRPLPAQPLTTTTSARVTQPSTKMPDPRPFALPELDDAVVSVSTLLGDPSRLLQVVDAYDNDHPQIPPGQIMRFTTRADHGIRIIEIWQSADALESWLANSSMPKPEIHPLHRVRVGRW